MISISSLSLSQCVLMCTSGVAVTPSNVLRAVREVEKWWGGGGLRDWLDIPESKEKEIRQNFPDEMDQKKQSMTYWIDTDPLASWRRLINYLDWMEETKVANSIRSNAEPLTGNHTHSFLPCGVDIHSRLFSRLYTCSYIYRALHPLPHRVFGRGLGLVIM